MPLSRGVISRRARSQMEGTMKHSNVVVSSRGSFHEWQPSSRTHGIRILFSHQTERSSVTKPREQEVSAWHDEAGERLVWTPRAAVQLMLHA
jgi:hypothetical protein